MKFIHFRSADINQLVEIHKNAFTKEHFTAFFPDELLRKYLLKLIEANEYNIGAYNSEGIMTGFIIAGTKSDIVIKQFTSANLLTIFWQLMKHPFFLIEKIVDLILRFTRSKNISKEQVRLYLFEIDRPYQGEGLGKELLEYFENLLLSKQIFSFGLSVRKKNRRAVNFYERNGFKKEFSDYKSIFFIKSLKIDNN